MNRLLLFVGVMWCALMNSQTITVVDKVSREPLPGVVISSGRSAHHVTTNARGQADISGFSGSDSVKISYFTYKTRTLSYEQLKSNRRTELQAEGLALNEVVVSANRWEEQAAETANRIEKITKKQVELQNPQTTADLIESNGYVYLQKSQLAGGSPILRGFATNRVLIVVDGVRMNNAIFRSGNLQNVISIDANAIEGTEIIFGPGAVMYGSDAIGGVMDFHTLRPKFSDSTGKVLTSANALGRYSTANSERTGHVDLTVGAKNWAFTSSFSRSDYGDLRAGTVGEKFFLRPRYVKRVESKDSIFVNPDSSLQVGSGFNQTNFMQKITFRFKGGAILDYGLHYSETSNAPRYDRLYIDSNNDGMPDNAEWYYGPQKWQMHRLGFTRRHSTAISDQLRVVAAFQDYAESRHDRRLNNAQLRNQHERVYAYSLNVDADKKLNDRMNLFYGAEGVYNLVRSRANRINVNTKVQTTANTRYPDNSTWQSYGVYANLKYRSSSRLIVNAGVRYSHYMISARFDTLQFPFPFVEAKNSNGAFNGSIGVVLLPAVSTRLYVNVSSGFRAPNIDDLGKVFDSQPGFVVVPNQQLGPEYAYSSEAGFVQTVGGALKLDCAAYYTLLDNALARRDFRYNGMDSIPYDGQMSKVLAIQNITHAYVYGFQGGITLSLSNGFGAQVKASYQEGEEQSEDSLIYYPKPHVPPFFARADLTYSRKNIVLDLYGIYNAGMSFSDLSLTDRTDHAPFVKDAGGRPYVPEWYTLNFKVAYYPGQRFAITGGVENILDKLYRPFSSGISAPGRNFIVSLRYRL